jgi:hypothetical protein
VVVEWLNVSGGVDAAPDWVTQHTELVRDGFAWVGVSAQKAGVEATRGTDPARDASLVHPGGIDQVEAAGDALQGLDRNRELRQALRTSPACKSLRRSI